VTQNETLGICIPIYKRPEQLRRCVGSVIRSAAPHRVAIHLSDDSTDDTNVEVVAELRREYPLVFHHRNLQNLGIDRNIVASVNLCQSRYAWLLGEDDRMVPEAVPTALAALSGSPAFLFADYSSIDEDVSMVLRERSLDVASDLEMPADAFLRSYAWAAGFIGACVVNRDLWKTVPPEPYLGTWFAHVGVIMQSVAGRQVRIVSAPLVLNRCGAARAFTWTGSTFDVLGGWARMVERLRAFYPADVCDEAVASFSRAHGLGSVAFFGYLRADRALDAEAWRRHVRKGPYPAWSRGAAWCIARTPPGVFQAARWALTSLRRLRKRRLTGY